MPLTLKHLQSDTATATLEYAGETVHLIYKPSSFTPAFIARLAGVEKSLAAGEEDAFDNMVASLCSLMVSWDVLEDDDGAILPVTPDVLSEFEIGFIGALYQALLTDATLGKRTGTKKSAA
jgi:hypothetical protein